MGEKERGAHQNGGHCEMARVQVQRTHCSCSLYVRVCWKPPSLPPINSTNSTNSVIGRSVIVACHNQKSTSCLLLAKEKKIRLPRPVDARFVYVSFVRCKNYGPLRKRKRKESALFTHPTSARVLSQPSSTLWQKTKRKKK